MDIINGNFMQTYKVLHLEDDLNDAELIKAYILKSDIKANITLVDDKKTFCQALLDDTYDVILLDYNTPTINAPEALKIIRQQYNTPVIIISGYIDDKLGIQTIEHGAVDYIMKDNLVRLPISMKRAIKEYHAIKQTKENNLINQQLLIAAHATTFKIDTNYQVIDIESRFAKLMAIDNAQSESFYLLDYVHPEDKNILQKKLNHYLKQSKPFTTECRFVSKKGHCLWFKLNLIPEYKGVNIAGFVITAIDISELKTTQNELRKSTYYDKLTALPNRNLALKKINKFLKKLRSQNIQFFLLLHIDVNLRKINDVFGYKDGDQFLLDVTHTLQYNTRSEDFIARVSSNEFIVLIKHIKQNESAITIANRLLNTLKNIKNNKEKYHTYFSMGALIIDSAFIDKTNTSILQYGEKTLTQAKLKDPNAIVFYTDIIDEKQKAEFNMESSLHKAIEKNELSLVYQPQLDTLTNRIIGCEVLLRWQHDNTFISPSVFIPLAEKCNLIDTFSAWVIKHATAQFHYWRSNNPTFLNHDFYLSINLSPVQFKHEALTKLFSILEHRLSQFGIQPKNICIELTETTLMDDLAKVKETLDVIASKNFNIAIDDFGTGYSSLSYLKELPINIIKIDKSFISDLESNDHSKALTQGTILLAKSLGIKVIAEGVETKAQLAFLQEQGCHLIQGYYFSKPLNEDKFLTFVEKFRLCP